ncbi:MAG: response regulator transcription factor [Chloroflexaceae bacterium]|nr:response regulator transcription factor [Chloroflexaceae bacterium]
MTKPIRILLTEDHTLVRAGFRALLRDIEGIEVIAEAGDGREALRLIESDEPDVVFMDIAMSGLNGLDATARATRDFPNVRIIMLSMHASEEYVLQALRAGAVGYLLKDAGTAELELAIRAVARGETYLSPAVSKHVVADYVRRVGGEPSSLERLTPRQREVLQLIAEGHTTQDIAQTLTISVKTVETHRAQLMERLGIHDIVGLVRYAIRMGLVTSEE